MKIGILGAGTIAKVMAKTLKEMSKVECYAVSSRELKKAELFAKQYEIRKFYGSYEDMLKDENIDLVYIATPHSHHYAHIKMCLENGKNVICEKPFTTNSREAKEVLELAKSKRLFITEAMWTRYMPMRNIISNVISSGIIGKVTSLTANLGYPIDNIPRLKEPELSGGALLDLGVYTINFALMVFGDNIENISSTAVLTDKGVDSQNSITITYKDGRMAILHSNMMALTDRSGIINGDKGFMIIENINNPEKIKVFSLDRREILTYERPRQISGYEYEILSSISALKNEKLECIEMPHSETIKVMEIMDYLRSDWGVIYPADKINK